MLKLKKNELKENIPDPRKEDHHTWIFCTLRDLVVMPESCIHLKVQSSWILWYLCISILRESESSNEVNKWCWLYVYNEIATMKVSAMQVFLTNWNITGLSLKKYIIVTSSQLKTLSSSYTPFIRGKLRVICLVSDSEKSTRGLCFGPITLQLSLFQRRAYNTNRSWCERFRIVLPFARSILIRQWQQETCAPILTINNFNVILTRIYARIKKTSNQKTDIIWALK